MKNPQKGFATTPLIIAIVAVLAIAGGVYFYETKTKSPTDTNVQSQNNPSPSISNTAPVTAASCGDFAALSDYVLKNIQQPDSQNTMQANKNVITSIRWKRSSNEPFVSYPIINGVQAFYGNQEINRTHEFIVSAIKSNSDTLDKTINEKVKSLGLSADSLNTSPFQTFSNQDIYLRTLAFRGDDNLYSITLKVEGGGHQAPPVGVVTVTCGKAINQYDQVYNALNFKADASVQDSYDNDYVAIADISSDKTVYAVLGSSNQVKLANYYYFDGKTAKLVSDDSYPANCLTLESQKVGQGMRCADNLSGTQRTVNYAAQSTKSYSNNQYGFQFAYPQDFSIEEHAGIPFSITLRDANNTFPVQIFIGSSNDPKITGLTNPQNNQFQQIYTAGKVNGGNIIWNMFEVDDIPQEGRGTAGSEQTYYTKKGDSTYVLQCLNCSPRIFGDITQPALSAFGQILSTFKFK